MNLKKYCVIGIFLTVLLGTLLHFTYDLSGNSDFIAILSAVNESTWEHSKLIYYPMIIFAIIGLVVNLIATYVTHGGKSINQKAVNLHMLEDVFGWLVVLVGSVVIKYTGLYIIDPILSILVAIFIIINSLRILIKIFEIFLIKVPKNIDIDQLIEQIKKVDGVIDVHHIHIWTIDGEINCATLHLVVKEKSRKIMMSVKEEMEEHEISHTTIEIETLEDNCCETSCSIKEKNKFCHHNHHHH